MAALIIMALGYLLLFLLGLEVVIGVAFCLFAVIKDTLDDWRHRK